MGMTASTLKEMTKVVKVRVESSEAALAQLLRRRRSGLGLVERVEAMM